jgi:hypothetical protein
MKNAIFVMSFVKDKENVKDKEGKYKGKIIIKSAKDVKN